MNGVKEKVKSICIQIIGFMIVAFIIISIAKSHSEESKESEKETETETEIQTQLTEEREKVFEVWYSYTKYEPYLKKMAEEFEAETGIKVKLTYYTSIDYLNKISARSMDGNGPDIFLISEDNLQNAVLLGIAEQNTELSGDDYLEKAIQATVYDGKNYGYPLGFETSVFVANKKYVKKMPKTFDEVKEFADNFNGEDNDKYADVSSILKWDVSNALYSYGFLGNYLNLGGENGDNEAVVDVNNKNAIKAGKYFYSLAEYFYTDVTKTQYNKILNEFSKGKIIYTIASADVIDIIKKNELSVFMSPLPALTEELGTKALSVTDIFMINPFADQKEEARQFAKYVTNDKADKMYENCRIISAKNTTYENEYLNSFVQAYEQSANMPKLMTTSDYWLKISNLVTDIWNGESVKEMLNSLNEELIERLK